MRGYLARRASAQIGQVYRGESAMAEIRRDAETEPVGIVISRGSRAEAAPKFLAYVWGPAPEAAIEEASKAA